MQVLEAWEDEWVDHSSGKLEDKFRDFAISKPVLARGVFQQLALLLRIFGNAEKLKKKYGLSVKTKKIKAANDHIEYKGHAGHKAKRAEDPTEITKYLTDVDRYLAKDAIKNFQVNTTRHLSFFRKIHFVLSGKGKEFENLITLLVEFNTNLHAFTRVATQENSLLRMFEKVSKGMSSDNSNNSNENTSGSGRHRAAEDPARAKRLASAAAYEAKHSEDPDTRSQYSDMAKFAEFVETVKSQASLTEVHVKRTFQRADFSFDDPYVLDGRPAVFSTSTLARLHSFPDKHQSRLVIVEWVATQSGTLEERLVEAKKLCNMLRADKPDRLLLPNSYGIIHDNSHIGIVLTPPSHIRSGLSDKLSRGKTVLSPSTIAAQRKPKSLRKLLTSKPALDLGMRFRTARKLLGAIHLMHCAGWVHKNIRSDCILFFPTKASNGQPNPKVLDYTRPVFVGFNNSRLVVQDEAGDSDDIMETVQSQNITLDCYQHPDKRLNASILYRPQYDLYSLGCVLLEIGRWKKLEDFGHIWERSRCRTTSPGKNDILEDARDIKAGVEGLESHTGSIYANVVRKCLSFGSEHIGENRLSEIERTLSASLAQCVA